MLSFMITRTFLSKCNTIVSDTKDNFGLYPIGMLNHGLITSRILIYFDLENIKPLFDDGVYTNRSKVKHTLKMFNCGSVDPKRFHDLLISRDTHGIKKRATGFEVIAFKVPKPWERGDGFDDSTDKWLIGDAAISKGGSNWYNSKSGVKWDNEGIYTQDQLFHEYDKYKNGEESIIICSQDFNYGNENLSLDITDYINDCIDGKVNNRGICIAFSPVDETSDVDITQYIGFFTDRTNTYYQPVIETRYNDSINDDRYKFTIGKENRLYLYSDIGGEPKNLDELPVCTIDGKEFEVVHQTKGVYYANVTLEKDNYEADMIVEDIWSNIKYQGYNLDDVEMGFQTHAPESYFKIGKKATESLKISVTLNGIKDEEKLNRGEIREVSVGFLQPYMHRKAEITGNVYYKIYVMDGIKEVNVIDWDEINQCAGYSYFLIDTNGLVPQDYRVDIKVENGRETTLYKNELHFKIVNSFSEK